MHFMFWNLLSSVLLYKLGNLGCVLEQEAIVRLDEDGFECFIDASDRYIIVGACNICVGYRRVPNAT